MKTIHMLPALALAFGAGLVSTTVSAGAGTTNDTPLPGSASRGATFTYEQRLYSPGGPQVAPATAAEIISRFRACYGRLGQPRFLIYVNRKLVDQESGLKLQGREETVVSNHREATRETGTGTTAEAEAGGGVTAPTSGGSDGGSTAAESTPARAAVTSTDRKVAHVNTYKRVEREADSFEYTQMVRDLEIILGRRLRSAGASLVDQEIATQLIADRPLREFAVPTEGEQARKDREAITRHADVVIEILYATREVAVPSFSGHATRIVPDIKVKAIRLADARIMGQASSADVMRHQPRAAVAGGGASTEAIADATALSFLEDMLLGLQP